MIIVTGHKNPDTDSAVSAIVFAHYLNKEGKEAQGVVAGDINRETEYVFNYFNYATPKIIESERLGEKSVFLVDHNDLSQSVAKKENIYGVLDHHQLAGLTTNETVYFRVEPLGSTASLIYKMMKEKGMDVEKKIAGLLLSAIISDTLNLNSSTTTTEDVDYYYELSKIAQIDPGQLAEEMFAAKSDFSGKDVKEIITGDMKEYNFGGKKIGIGVAETTSTSYFEKNEKEVLEGIRKIKEENSFDNFFFGVVDIVKNIIYFYCPQEEEKDVVRKVFNGEEKENFFLLTGISSRKKEIAPPLSEFYEKNK